MRQLFLTLLLLTQCAAAQQFYKNINIPVKQNGVDLDFPWAGGIDKGTMCDVDLNNDGILDLFIYEKNNAGQPGRITTFINNGTPNSVSYEHAPQYQLSFPEMRDWAILFDYNCDGKKDLWTWVSQGARVYKNISQPNQSIQFALEYVYVPADGTANMYVARTDHPAVADYDGDGDVDVVCVYILGSYYIYYKNLAMEQLNRCDTLILETQNNCFGQLYLGSVNNSATLGVSCRQPSPTLFDSPSYIDTGMIRDGGNCSMPMDYDHDGDYDLFVGDKLASSLLRLTNDGTNTMTSQDSLFPVYDVPVELYEFPAAYFIDVDNDGKRDMIISSCDKSEAGENYYGTLHYKNIGTSTLDSFTFQSNVFLVDNMIDVGSGAAPRFFDADADGLLDIIVGNRGVFQISPDSVFEGGLMWYKNTGTLTAPQFELQTIDYAGLFQYAWNDLKPTFGDMDGDADADMIVGITDGSMQYFENNAPMGQPANFVLTGQNYFSLDVGKRCAPYIYDLNKDGLLDIIAGNQLGQLYYYQNNGTVNTPSFAAPIMGIGGVNVVPPFSIVGNATPFLFNDNGTTKLLVGNEYGYSYFYDNIDGNIGGQFNLVDSTFYDIKEPIRSFMDGADITGDGNMDIVVGNNAGGLCIYTYSPVNISNIDKEIPFTIMPNPTHHYVVIKASLPLESIAIYSVDGKLVLEKKLRDFYTTIETSQLQNGLYFCRIKTMNGNIYTEKLLKN